MPQIVNNLCKMCKLTLSSLILISWDLFSNRFVRWTLELEISNFELESVLYAFYVFRRNVAMETKYGGDSISENLN